MNKKRVVMLIVLSVVIISIISVSAGFWDLFKFGKEGEGLEGELPSKPVNVSVTMANEPPQVIWWPSLTVTPYEDNIPEPRAIVITVTAYDPNGYEDILMTDGGAMWINVSINDPIYGWQGRYNGTCIDIPSQNTPNTLNYSCTVRFNYWDYSSISWIITANVSDGTGSGQNVSSAGGLPYFSVGSIGSFKMNRGNLSWTGVTTGTTNMSANENVTLSNIGNRNVTASSSSWIQLNGTRLRRVGDPSDYINGSSFGVNEDVSTCGTVSPFDQPDRFVESTFINVEGAALTRGNYNVYLAANRTLRFCLINIIPTPIPSGNYVTNLSWEGPWGIEAIFAI